ncbi:DUF3157 family protein [Proteiniphilum sp. X52]|uniref:DUF3157 family protein n=1 Tax=Proteiniphilum sp. X52 TaxID=2382159 RepID=UPI000F0A4367|nr:DUF3157 family protein [Proteiniphilum sp. X52]RNC66433.1 DUF3157 family protein [Proteiniphilum sp. X52]
MRKLILIVFAFIPFLINAQKKIEVVKLSNGKHITIFDDYTWKNSTISEIGEYEGSGSNNSNKAIPLKSTTNTSKTSISKVPSQTTSSSYSSTCGARTKSGGYCKRVVKGGGRCWQHR